MLRDDRDTLSTIDEAPAGRERVCALTVLFHPDLNRVGDRAIVAPGSLAVARGEPVFGDEPLGDPYLSREPMRVIVQGAGARVVAGGQALAVNGEPVAGEIEVSRAALDEGVVLQLGHRVVLLLHRSAHEAGGGSLGFVGENDAMVALRRSIERVADLDVPVLIRGETGTGKELVARAVHAASTRAHGPFVSVNMSAVPPSTAASELFGHRRGAFTDATSDHDGYFMRAADGTLFLDEIGATPPEVQPMLLRALELHEIQPLGATAPVWVKPRFIAATDADLERAIRDSSFRAALLHRLESFQLFVPPLRQRRDDIGRLLVHFLLEELGLTGETFRIEPTEEGEPTWIPASLVARIARLDWTGNVRQLRNFVRQLVISSRGSERVVLDEAVNRVLASAEEKTNAVPPASGSEISEDDLLAALRKHDYRANAAAAELGLSRSAMYERIKKSSRVRTAESLTAAEIEDARDAHGGDTAAMARALEVSERGLKLRMSKLRSE